MKKGKKIKLYTNEDIKNYIPKTRCRTELLKLLNLNPDSGSNHRLIKQKINKLKIDVSHWDGHYWARGKQKKDFSKYSTGFRLKPHLIKLRGNNCECCKNNTWLEKPISLEVHHLDGNNKNNKLENLQLLCPNCHSYTPNYRRMKKTKIITGILE